MSVRGSRALPPLSLLGALLALSSPSLALTQPNGATIPSNGDLQSLFDQAQDPINAVLDAADVPETFNPTCNLTFNLISRGNAAFKNVFGWYNVTGQKPDFNDLHVLIPCDAQPPVSFPLAIKADPAYLGGEVGFFLITPEGKPDLCASKSNVGYIYYSQKAFNPDNTGPNSYIHLAIYDSKALPKSFYFAWEDLYSGGDNNFTDFVARVDGITCTGGGGMCETGQPGVCNDGTEQCQNGMLTCVQSTQPSTEKCDGLDNDCNGTTDEGDICPAGKVCDKATCVPKCNGGEFTCAADEVCDENGYCVDPACANVNCPSGQKCIAGMCKGPCDGVTCPHGQVCRVGACVDPCAGLSCDPSQVCVAGACVDNCSCAGCPMGESCQADGICLSDPCVGKQCGPGEYCAMDGTCTDACSGAVCPAGEVCQMGQCVPGPMGTGGMGGAGGGIFGTGGGGAGGGSTTTTTTSGTGGAGGAGGQGGDGGSGGIRVSKAGCVCSMGEPVEVDFTALGAALAALGALGRKRRR
ncbi:MAG: DUF4114 domain-containing protein [Byssovorax sp.]